jgi:glycosyltransferase involved in cell wall biosynthesis
MALPVIPYMRGNLRRKQATLARASAIVAVSRSVEDDLRRRAPTLSHARIESIPNAVDVADVRAQVAQTLRPVSEPYAVFVGKLSRNKGAQTVVDVASRARLTLPLVVIGDGPERRAIASAATAAGRDIRLLGWLDRREVFRWLRHATLLMFPSTWPEPLSRVLIEASALSVPIAAINTGGTADVVVHEQTGLLSSSVDGLAVDVARLEADAQLRGRLGEAAGRRAESHFDSRVVIDRMEALYRGLVSPASLHLHARA